MLVAGQNRAVAAAACYWWAATGGWLGG